MPHLLVDISSHGYGHVSQTAPVVNELARRIPDLKVTLRTGAPPTLLAQRFQCEFLHIPLTLDFGMKMVSAIEVQVEASHAAYNAWHTGWDDRVAHEARAIRELSPDLLLANVPYLSLAAAKVAGVRAVAMCSLNWADIYRHYCRGLVGSDVIHRQMLDAYGQTEAFLRIQPAMPMSDLPNLHSIACIATPGRALRAELARRLQLERGERCVLVAMGGMEFRLPMERWPRLSGVRWLVPAAWGVERSDTIAFDTLEMSFSDLLASCDAVLTKPGYGTFAEAACVGVPVLYAARRDWPESPYLVEWLERHVPCLEVEHAHLQNGALTDQLHTLWSSSLIEVAQLTGIHEAAEYLARQLEMSISKP